MAYPPDSDIGFWRKQAEHNADEIISLREALKRERRYSAAQRKLLDCYKIALNAFMEDADEH